MHIVKILYHMHVRYAVERFAKINESSKDSVGLLEVKSRVDEMQELY